MNSSKAITTLHFFNIKIKHFSNPFKKNYSYWHLALKLICSNWNKAHITVYSSAYCLFFSTDSILSHKSPLSSKERWKKKKPFHLTESWSWYQRKISPCISLHVFPFLEVWMRANSTLTSSVCLNCFLRENKKGKQTFNNDNKTHHSVHKRKWSVSSGQKKWDVYLIVSFYILYPKMSRWVFKMCALDCKSTNIKSCATQYCASARIFKPSSMSCLFLSCEKIVLAQRQCSKPVLRNRTPHLNLLEIGNCMILWFSGGYWNTSLVKKLCKINHENKFIRYLLNILIK